jgi:hypothetical protein
MSLSSGGSSPIEISEMLDSIKGKAQEKGVSMKEYLTTELSIPEEEAPLLHSAVSCLDAKSVTSSNAPVATKNTTYSNNGGVKQEAVTAPVGATLTATRTSAPNVVTTKNTTYSNNGGITQQAVNAPVGATLTATRTPAPNQGGGRKNKRKPSRRHKKRKATRKTRRR